MSSKTPSPIPSTSKALIYRLGPDHGSMHLGFGRTVRMLVMQGCRAAIAGPCSSPAFPITRAANLWLT